MQRSKRSLRRLKTIREPVARRKDGNRTTLAAGRSARDIARGGFYSPIKRAEYSLDAGDWQFVRP